MPVRTDDEAVKGIIVSADEEESVDLSPFIAAANMLVSARCLPLAYTEDELTIIETWLAAHFYSCDRSRLGQEVIGKASETIVSRVDLGLNLTHHGQQVQVLDYLGGLAGLGTDRKKIKVTWLGKTPETRNYRRSWPPPPGL